MPRAAVPTSPGLQTLEVVVAVGIIALMKWCFLLIVEEAGAFATTESAAAWRRGCSTR